MRRVYQLVNTFEGCQLFSQVYGWGSCATQGPVSLGPQHYSSLLWDFSNIVPTFYIFHNSHSSITIILVSHSSFSFILTVSMREVSCVGYTRVHRICQSSGAIGQLFSMIYGRDVVTLGMLSCQSLLGSFPILATFLSSRFPNSILSFLSDSYSNITLAGSMRDLLCVGYTPRAWDHRFLQSTHNNIIMKVEKHF